MCNEINANTRKAPISVSANIGKGDEGKQDG